MRNPLSLLLALALRLYLVSAAHPRRRDDRGDVPGWVLVTLMTVGLVGVIGVIAQEQLTSILRSALSSVR